MITSFSCGYCGRTFEKTQGRASHERGAHGRVFRGRRPRQQVSDPAPKLQPRKDRVYVVLPGDLPDEKIERSAEERAILKWGPDVELVFATRHQISDWTIVIAHVDVPAHRTSDGTSAGHRRCR